MVIAPYRKIMESLRAEIASGRLKPGDRIPSENEIAASFSVSRMTANRAVRELAQEGLVTRAAGSGSFVALSRMELSLLRVPDIAEEIAAGPGGYSALVIEKASVKASELVAAALEMPTATTILHTVLIHCAAGQPVQLEDRYVRPSFAPDYLAQDFTKITPNAYLTAIARPDEVEQIVEAVAADAVTARLLGIARGHSCLTVTRRTWSLGKAVTFSRLTSPGEGWRMSVRFKL
jgi:GntR family transcriptional regulator, histidine utilization repressor